MILFAAGPPINLAAVAPFALLLAAVAILPLAFGSWWHPHRNKLLVAGLTGAPIAIYLLFLPGGLAALTHGLEEYLQFIVLIGSLYIIAGGVALTGDLAATPRVNALFLGGGAVLANFIGTTGASMLLIRPLLRTNRERHHTAHIPVFFILIVSNCGGLLTPLGDPPLFLGFLEGVEFFWTLRLAPQWLIVNGWLLGLFYFWDRRAWRHETREDIREEFSRVHPLRLYGWALNAPLMLGVIAAVLAKKYLGFPWCELIMLACAITSLLFTRRSVREANHFTWEPFIEVAVIFLAIFVTMIPVLILLQQHGRAAPLTEPWQFFWLTGVLSSGLDNAPTYMAMANLAVAISGCDTLHALSLQRPPDLLAAVSCGAVFFGANSYIGNGPNFMVKAIAEEMHYKMPSFFKYIVIASLILLPIYIVITILFFL